MFRCAHTLFWRSKNPQKPPFLHRKWPLEAVWTGQNPPVLGIFPIFANFGDFGQIPGIVRFRQGLKNRRLVDFQQCRSKRRTSEDVCEISHTLEGRALTLYSEWRSLAGADNFYIPSRWRWYSGLSCTSRCMKGTGVYDCVLFEREWLFLI